MERLNTHIGTADRTLQEAPEVLHAVSVDVAVNVALSVVDDLVGVLRIKPIVREKFIGHDFGAAPNVLADDPGKLTLAPRLDMLDMNLSSVAFQKSENDLLSGRAAPVNLRFAFVGCMLRAAPPIKVSSASTVPDILLIVP